MQNGGNNGQITSITDNTGTQEAGRSVTYTYDALYRLSSALTTGSASYPQWGLSWAYDRYGNRLSQSVTAGSAPANSLSFANPGGAQTNRPDGYGFDADGNMTMEPAPTLYTYQYDAETRLVNFTNSAATYTYDGNGLRVKKVSGSTTTVYIFSGSKVLAEYDNGAAVGSPTREYVYSGGALLAKIEAGATTYFHADHLSSRVLTDSGGNIAGQRGHYPYGDTCTRRARSPNSNSPPTSATPNPPTTMPWRAMTSAASGDFSRPTLSPAPVIPSPSTATPTSATSPSTSWTLWASR